jgi:prophage DNA circulation protein
MSWRDQLRPGSFRGVRFHLDDRSHETGRRIHNHEYPKRDENFAEDMGRKTRTWQVNAYVIGEDYMARRDALMRACEQQGPGSYSDRWRGTVQAVCEQITLVETEREGRYCKFSIKFIAAGAHPSALGIASATAQLVGASATLAGAAVASFAAAFPFVQRVDPDRLGPLGEELVELDDERLEHRDVSGAVIGLVRALPPRGVAP